VSTHDESEQERVVQALGDADSSVRLKAALQAGTYPAPDYLVPLVERCAVEPDFFVRDMLTWALIQQDHAQVIARLVPELGSDVPQARAQALHTLSKIGDTSVWPAITEDLLTDSDDDVARAAWRAAAALVPPGEEAALATILGTQWGRGDRDVRLSLSQALASLGDAAIPVVERGSASDDEEVRWHALATRRIIDNPDLAYDSALEEAKRVHTLRGAPLIPE